MNNSNGEISLIISLISLVVSIGSPIYYYKKYKLERKEFKYKNMPNLILHTPIICSASIEDCIIKIRMTNRGSQILTINTIKLKWWFVLDDENAKYLEKKDGLPVILDAGEDYELEFIIDRIALKNLPKTKLQTAINIIRGMVVVECYGADENNIVTKVINIGE